MGKKLMRAAASFLAFCVLFSASACKSADTGLTAAERQSALDFLGADAELSDISAAAVDAGARETTVKKVYQSGSDYVFFASPIGYNGPIDIMLVIDGDSGETSALRIVKHLETRHYVRDFESPWFTDRFKGKVTSVYMERVKLEAQYEHQVVAVTGSTVTTDAVVDGVNDCFDIFHALAPPGAQQAADEISLKAGGVIAGVLNLEKISALDSYKRRINIRSSSGDSVHDFRGVRLSEAIGLIDPELLSNHARIRVTGSDGYASELSVSEVMEENNVFLMYEDNGENLEWNSKQAFRIVILGDTYGQRFTNYAVEFEFFE